MSDLGSSIWSAAVLLFFLMDPIGNIPVILSVFKDVDPKRQRIIIIRELLIAFVVMVVFLFAGETLLSFLHIKQESVTITAGIILLIIGLRMIFPRPEGIMGKQPDGEPFIVPIAIPLIAGPSVLAMLILMTKNEPGHTTKWFLALLVAWFISALLLMAAPYLFKVLRERGMMAIERLVGMILVMMAVQVLTDGLKILL